MDLSGLQNANSFFLSSGVTVVGGAGDDILWGGTGADKISTGGGDNTVLGSLGEDKTTLAVNSGKDTIEYRMGQESAYGLGHDTIVNFNAFDTVDVSEIWDVAFIGNFADNASGIAALSTSQARAFFNTTTDTLYIDLNHDQALSAAHDMQIVLTGLDAFASFNLIS